MKKRLVDADKLMERAKMNSVLVTVEHDHHDYGMTLGALNKIVKECELPPAQPDKEKISDALYYIYRNKGTSTAAEGVAAIKYYIAEIWREIYGEEGPKWMKK